MLALAGLPPRSGGQLAVLAGAPGMDDSVLLHMSPILQQACPGMFSW